MSYTRISELLESPVTIVAEDYFSVVDSSSFTTYRAPLASLVEFINDTSSYANNTLSTSYANTSSHTTYADTASSCITASFVITASHLNYIPQTFVSYSLSSSWASQSLNALYAITASYINIPPQTFVSYSLSSSWVSSSISASNTITASFISHSIYAGVANYYNPLPSSAVSPIIAWASFTASNHVTDTILLNSSYNISEVKFSYFDHYSNWCTWNAPIVKFGYTFKFTNPIPNLIYSAWGTVYYHRTPNLNTGLSTAIKNAATTSVLASGLIASPRAGTILEFPTIGGVKIPIWRGANDVNGFTASFLNDKMTGDYVDYTFPDSWSMGKGFHGIYPQGYKASKVIGTIVVFGSGSY